jgi:hypothetical protein
MQKTCKSDRCQRKFEKTSLSDMCPPCTHAFNAGGIINQRRKENTTRQTSARSTSFDGSRDMGSLSPPSAHSSSQSSTTNNSSQPPPPTIDVNRLQDSFTNMQSGAVPDNTAVKDMYGMLLHLCSKSSETEEMKVEMKSNTNRIDRLEARVGGPEDIVVPLSITIRNLPMPAPGSSDLDLVKAVFREINANNVDAERDIIRVVRQGATQENLGSVMVEMSSDDTRASLMKTKKVLETHHNPGLRKLIIKNMKSRLELKVDIALNDILKKVPGGEQFYIANNGHLREKNHNQMHSNSRPFSNFNRHPNNPNFVPVQPRPNLNYQPNPTLPNSTFPKPSFPNQPNSTFPKQPNPTFPNITLPNRPNSTFPNQANPTFPNPTFPNHTFPNPQFAPTYRPTFNSNANPNQQPQFNYDILTQLQNLFSRPPQNFPAPAVPIPAPLFATQASTFDSLINLDQPASHVTGSVTGNPGLPADQSVAPHAAMTGQSTQPHLDQPAGEQSQEVQDMTSDSQE